jgi:hypothetical protein
VGYGWYPFAVDLTRVEGAFGCRAECRKGLYMEIRRGQVDTCREPAYRGTGGPGWWDRPLGIRSDLGRGARRAG